MGKGGLNILSLVEKKTCKNSRSKDNKFSLPSLQLIQHKQAVFPTDLSPMSTEQSGERHTVRGRNTDRERKTDIENRQSQRERKEGGGISLS